MKKIYLLFLLILLVACSSVTVEEINLDDQEELEEVAEELEIVEEEEELDTEEEIVEIDPKIEEEVIAKFYEIFVGESKIIYGNTIRLNDLTTRPEADISVNSKEYKFRESNAEEIIDSLSIKIENFNYENMGGTDSVTLAIEKFELGTDEYLIYEGKPITLSDKTIELKNSRADGWIEIKVFDSGNNYEKSIAYGETETIYGLEITNIKRYYKINEYAWIKIVEA